MFYRTAVQFTICNALSDHLRIYTTWKQCTMSIIQCFVSLRSEFHFLDLTEMKPISEPLHYLYTNSEYSDLSPSEHDTRSFLN